MTRERGAPHRPPLSPLRPRNHGGGGAAAADAVGSSTKDHAWQQRGRGAAASPSKGSRLAPLSDRKKSKKVEGVVVAGSRAAASAAQQPAPASRIPGARPRPAAPAAPTPATAGASRIPRPPMWAAAGASPQPDLAAMLATPAAAPLLEEMHAASVQRQPAAQAQEAAPHGFHAWSNPSYDGAQFLADTPAAGTAGAGGRAAAGTAVFVNRLAEGAEEEAGGAQLTPGLAQPTAITPTSDRSLEAWLRASPATAPAASAPHTATQGSSGRTAGPPLPTPEAWQLLQHINGDSDSPAVAPQGVHGIMNAFLRTGPQALSPEPAGAGGAGLIRAPGAAAVPASGLLNVTGPGGVGVYGMMNAYIRTGANMLSPEPGQGSQQQQGHAGSAAYNPSRPQPLLHPYSPVSPLVATPAAARALAGHAAVAAPSAGPAARGPISPSSVSSCSDGEADTSGPRAPSPSPGGRPAASVPRLNLAGLQQQQGGGTDGTEVSFGAALAAVGQAGSLDGELPTARLSPVAGARPQEQAIAGVAAQQQQRNGPPSPITFCLPGDSPAAAEGGAAPAVAAPARPDSACPSFSFGVGHAPADGADAAAAAQQAAVEPGDAAQEAAVHAVEAQLDDLEGGMRRIDSGAETVQQPNPFTAMLHHLRGPQYASPARFMHPPRADSPQSPQQCTPLHLISTSDAASPTGLAPGPTPAPGQGSMTVWMDRRGMRGALNTAARNDLRLLWAAAREVVAFKSEADTLRADNTALLGELEAAQAALRELGVEHEAAVVAAEAGALCAEAEVARARDAAGHMMALADQIQGMFALCENEKEALVSELAAAQEKLAQSEAAAADTAHLSEQQRAGLGAQLDEARQAVAAAQSAADAAQQRAVDAAGELETIRRQLAEAQAQAAGALAEAQAARAPDLTPVAKLRSQLGGVQQSLALLHAEQCAGRLHTTTPELDQLLEASRAELARVEVLLGGDTSALRSENAFLRSRLEAAHSALVRNSPAPAAAGAGDGHNPAFRDREQQEQYDRVMGRLRCLLGDDTPEERAGAPAGGRTDSPVPFALFGRLTSEGEDGAGSPASSSAAPSPDIFNSPFLAASQTTLTVDYRDLHSDLRSGWQQEASSPASNRGSPARSAASGASSEGSACWGDGSPEQAAAQDGATPAAAADGSGGGEGEGEFTVVHNGLVVTNVPASEVSKVRSMVQYWEAVANGTSFVPADATDEELAAAEAYATAAVAAAEAALAAQQAAQEQAAEQVQAGEPEQAHVLPGGSDGAAGAAVQASPAASPSGITPSRLPPGVAATPCSQQAAAGGTPIRLTPLSFVAAPPPTPADGVDPQQAQQLHHLAVSMAAAAAGGSTTPAGTPASAQRTASRLPSTPAGTPASAAAAAAAAAVTPLALSALRARMGGSGGAAQDAVRSRLARLKADLQAAQAKLATVDQGLASIAFTPTSSTGGTPGSCGSSIPRARTPPTPSTGGALGSPISGGSAGSPAAQPARSPTYGDSSRAAALVGVSRGSPLAIAGPSPPAVSQPPQPQPPVPAFVAAEAASVRAPAAAEAAAAPAAAQDSAPSPAPAAAAAAECTPPVTRRSVRFADAVPAGGSGRGALRMGTPYSAAAPQDDSKDGDEGSGSTSPSASASASPVVASCPRGRLAPAASPATAAAAPQRSPLAPMQSAAKPAGDSAAPWRFAPHAGDESGSSSDEDSELIFDASRMAQAARRAGSPAPALAGSPLRPGVAGGTPMAHPERGASAEAQESYGSHAAAGGRAGGAAATPATSVLSASSFSPPQPLVLLAVRPLGRPRRGAGLMRGGAAGARLRGEAEEREFRRRAAALNIQISPYFRRGGRGGDS